MDILYNIIFALGVLIFSYLISSFPVAIIIGHFKYNQDPRDYGSKNPGGTNAGRIWGKKIGFLIISLDIIKTMLPLFITALIVNYSGIKEAFNLFDNGILLIYLSCFASALGHCYPLFTEFKGGKAVSSYYGLSIPVSYLLMLTSFIYFLHLKIKKYVSLASILGTLTVTLLAWVMGIIHMLNIFDMNLFLYGGGKFFSMGVGYELSLSLTLINLLLIYRHRANIKRIISGEESKITWMK